jgi:type I restriction enzyme, S subunit
MNVVFFGFKRDGLVFLDNEQADSLNSAIVRANDILLNITGASIGRVTLAPADMDGARVNQHVCIIRPGAGIDSRFLSGLLSSPRMQDQIWSENYGVTRQALTKQQILGFEIPLPPLNEQKRIADKLDALLARVETCRDRLDRVLAILKRFRQGVLVAATSGRLTEDWRARFPETAEKCPLDAAPEPEGAFPLPETWKWIPVGSVARKVTDGVHKKPTYLEAGVPFLTVRNLTAGAGIDFAETNFISEADHAEFCKRTRPEMGDILITKDGTLGVVRKIDTDRDFSIFVSLALIKLHDNRTSGYISYAFQAPVMQKQMVGVGTGLQHIHLRDLKQDVLPIPPLEEQTEIVRRVESLFAWADRLEARVTAARAQVDRLTPALLAKAFRGELVPQDPADEPAVELLARILRDKGESISAAGKRGRAPKRKAQAPVAPSPLAGEGGG